MKRYANMANSENMMADKDINDIMQGIIKQVVDCVELQGKSIDCQTESFQAQIDDHEIESNNVTSYHDQWTQTTCTCQCQCGVKSFTGITANVASLDRAASYSIIAGHNFTPVPNKRKRGRPRKHPAAEGAPKGSAKVERGVIKIRGSTTRTRKARNPTESDQHDSGEVKITAVDYNRRRPLPTLKIKLERVNVEAEKEAISQGQLKSLHFVEITNAINNRCELVDSLSEDGSQNLLEDIVKDENASADETNELAGSLQSRSASAAEASKRLVYEETHGCDFCGKRFKEMGDLKKHKRKQHGVEEEEVEEEEEEEEYSVYEDVSDDSEYSPSEPEYTSKNRQKVSRHSAKPHVKSKGKKLHSSETTKESEEGGVSLDLTNILGEGTSLMEVTQVDEASGEKLLTCVICNKVFKGESNFLRHLGTHSGRRPYICIVCGQGFNRKRNLVRHQSKHSQERPFSCDICHKSLKTESGLKSHLRQHENLGDKPYGCDMCDKRFAQKVGLDIHKATVHEGKRPYKCDFCDQTFGRMSHMVRHAYKHKVEEEGLELPHECKKCGKRYSREDQLKIHDRTHTGERPYSCLICDKTFKSSGDLAGHRRVHLSARQFVCQICGASFKHNRGLKRHMIGHSDERPHICEFCGLSFKQEQTLKIHQRTHTGYKPFKCTLCDYACGQRGNLNSHMAKHTDERSFTCEVCGKQFKHVRHMKRHMVTHTDDKQHQCEICGKFFSRLSSRSKHMFIHSGQKPYNCKVCGKTFRQSSTLSVHMMIHNNQRPFSCDACSATFRRFAHLQRHRRTHTGEKPYECIVCHKRFTRPVCLPNHMKRHLAQGDCTEQDLEGSYGSMLNLSEAPAEGSSSSLGSSGHGQDEMEGYIAGERDVDQQSAASETHQPHPSAIHGAIQGAPIHPLIFTVPYFAPSDGAWPCQ